MHSEQWITQQIVVNPKWELFPLLEGNCTLSFALTAPTVPSLLENPGAPITTIGYAEGDSLRVGPNTPAPIEYPVPCEWIMMK